MSDDTRDSPRMLALLRRMQQVNTFLLLLKCWCVRTCSCIYRTIFIVEWVHGKPDARLDECIINDWSRYCFSKRTMIYSSHYGDYNGSSQQFNQLLLPYIGSRYETVAACWTLILLMTEFFCPVNLDQKQQDEQT